MQLTKWLWNKLKYRNAIHRTHCKWNQKSHQFCIPPFFTQQIKKEWYFAYKRKIGLQFPKWNINPNINRKLWFVTQDMNTVAHINAMISFCLLSVSQSFNVSEKELNRFTIILIFMALPFFPVDWLKEPLSNCVKLLV